MKIFKMILFIILILFIPIGIIFRYLDMPEGGGMLVLGFLGLFIVLTYKTVKLIANNKLNDKLSITFHILIILMTMILFTKYLYYRIGDYPGLLIIPFYILTSIAYLFKRKNKDFKFTITIILFLLLSIPLFGLEFHKSPREYVPQEWYNRYTVDEEKPVRFSYGFKYLKTENISKNAFTLLKSERYYEAIILYNKALELEPKNPNLLFNLSECYAKTNDLEKAISFLDTAIIIDSTNFAFYNNRGFYYLKLKENTTDLKVNFWRSEQNVNLAA